MQIYFFGSLTGNEGMEKGGLARRPPFGFAGMIPKLESYSCVSITGL